MDNNEKFDQLFADEVFQDEILQMKDSSKEEQKVFCEKYSLSEKELVYAKTFFAGISFRREHRTDEEINYADYKLQKAIQNSPVAAGTKLRFIDWISRAAAIFSIPLLLSTLYFYQNHSNLVTHTLQTGKQ